MSQTTSANLGIVTASSASGQTTGFDVRDHDHATVYLNVSNVTAGSVTIKIQVSPDNSNWYDLGITTTAISAAGNSTLRIADLSSRFIRLDYVIVTGPVTFKADIDLGVNGMKRGARVA